MSGSDWENENVGSWGVGDTWDNAQEYLKFQANNEGYNTVAELREAYGDDGINEMLGMAGYKQEDVDDLSDGDVKALTEGIKQEVGKQGTVLDAANVTINASSVNMDGVQGNNGIKTIEEAKIEEGNVENGSGGETNDINADGGEISLEGVDEISLGELFANTGVLEQLGTLANTVVDGVHSISSGLYIDGDAPTGEWNENSKWRQQNIKEVAEERKKRVDRAKDNWAHNKANIKVMADIYMPDMKKIYQGKSEEYIRMKAEEKAKSALKDMSEYVPYGITDVRMAYELYKDANNYGYSPEEAIRSRAGYEKFNSSSANINSINLSGSFQRNDYTSVEAAIPDARTYYNAGYTDINEMAWVEKIAQSLGKSPEFAMKVDETLKKKGGKINYSGKNDEMKKLIADINAHYGG